MAETNGVQNYRKVTCESWHIDDKGHLRSALSSNDMDEKRQNISKYKIHCDNFPECKGNGIVTELAALIGVKESTLRGLYDIYISSSPSP